LGFNNKSEKSNFLVPEKREGEKLPNTNLTPKTTGRLIGDILHNK